MHFENLELIQSSLHEKNNYKKTVEKMQNVEEKEEKNKKKNFSLHDDSEFNFSFNDILSDDFNKTFKSNLGNKLDVLNNNVSSSNVNLNFQFHDDFYSTRSMEGSRSIIKNNFNRYNDFNDTLHSYKSYKKNYHGDYNNYDEGRNKNYKNTDNNSNNENYHYNRDSNNINSNKNNPENNNINDDINNFYNNNNNNNFYDNNNNNINRDSEKYRRINNRQKCASSTMDVNCIERAFSSRNSDIKTENTFKSKIPSFCVKPYFRIWHKNVSAKLNNSRRLESHFSFLKEK